MNRQISATRRDILLLLRREGPKTVDALSVCMGITPVGIRKHLDVLESNGLVRYATERRRIGRPAQVYSLTDAADEVFPKAYDSVLASILRQVQRIGGDELLDRVLDGRTEELEAACRAKLGNAASLEEKLQAFTQVRDEAGYMAECGRDGDAFRFTEYNCALCHVARLFPAVCASEIDLLQRVLGESVVIERSEHLMGGDRCCTYRITPRPATAGVAAGAPACAARTAA